MRTSRSGIATSLTYVLVIIIRVKLDPSLAPPVDEKPTWAEHRAAIKSTWPIVVLIMGVLGGLFGGLFTATQAGAVGAAVAGVKPRPRWPGGTANGTGNGSG